jgi:trans-aconitate methyltransferase
MTSERAATSEDDRGTASTGPRRLPLGWMTAPEWSVAAAAERAAIAGHEASAMLSDPARPAVDEELVELAADLPPGKALDLGCGVGQNSIWLAQRGWVVTAVDMDAAALDEARDAASSAGSGASCTATSAGSSASHGASSGGTGALAAVGPGVPDGRLRIVWEQADLTAWRPASRYDLVVSTFALPPRGMGRARLLDMAASAVAPGAAILVRELDVAFSREGRMAERYLVSREEVERHLDGFRITRSRVRLTSRPHGFEEIVLPVATVVATRRTDLRTLY